MAVPPLLTFNVTIDFNDINAGCVDVALRLRPDWKSEDIKFKSFSSGLMNKMVALYTTGFKDALVFRIFSSSDQSVDRELEIITYRTLGERGLSSDILCRFNNGICVSFCEGRTFNWNYGMEEMDEIRNSEKICNAMIRAAAELHSKKTAEVLKKYGGSVSAEPLINDFILSYYNKEYPDELEIKDESLRKRMKETFPSKEEVEKEINFLMKIHSESNMRTAFGNMDLNPTNFIYNEEEDKAYMIDFEYCGRDYIAYDLVLVMCGMWHGMNSHPDKETLFIPKEWLIPRIRVYLETALKLGDYDKDHVNDEDVEKMFADYRIANLTYAFCNFVFFLCSCKNEEKSVLPNDSDFDMAKGWLTFYKRMKEKLIMGNQFLETS